MKPPKTIRVIVMPCEVSKYWIASGLDWGLAAMGKTAEAAFDHWKRQACGCVELDIRYPESVNPWNDAREGPKVIQELWDESKDVTVDEFKYDGNKFIIRMIVYKIRPEYDTGRLFEED